MNRLNFFNYSNSLYFRRVSLLSILVLLLHITIICENVIKCRLCNLNDYIASCKEKSLQSIVGEYTE